MAEVSRIQVVSLPGGPEVAVSVAASAAVPVLLTPEAAVAADGAPSVVLGVTWCWMRVGSLRVPGDVSGECGYNNVIKCHKLSPSHHHR